MVKGILDKGLLKNGAKVTLAKVDRNVTKATLVPIENRIRVSRQASILRIFNTNNPKISNK